MSKNWVKIDDELFYILESSVQLSFGSHANLDIKIDKSTHPEYQDLIFNKYEEGKKISIIKNSIFLAKGCLIKSIDVDTKQLNVSLRCDILDPVDTSERRDEIIDEVLNNDDKNNIK